MLIYAKSALTKEQLDCKMEIGCDGVELQLLGELIDGSLGHYHLATDVFDLEDFKDYPISVVHAPLLSSYGLSDVNIESFIDSDFKLLDQVFYIANYFGEIQNKSVIVVLHSETDRQNMMLVSDTWKHALNSISCLLFKYPYTEIAIENVTPLRRVGSSDIHLCNNFHYDNVDMALEFRKQLHTDRVGTCLDTCHAMITEKFMKAVYQELDDLPCEDYSLDGYFSKNKDVIKLIHLSDAWGSGYGKGKHSMPFVDFTKEKLKGIISLYKKYNYICPITLEINETDYQVCEGYQSTKKVLECILEEGLD